jgi:hypothetical protein
MGKTLQTYIEYLIFWTHLNEFIMVWFTNKLNHFPITSSKCCLVVGLHLNLIVNLKLNMFVKMIKISNK